MIIVTGGAGFIGSALVWGLNERGINDIVIVDDVESDHKWKNLVKRTFHTILPIDGLFPWLQKEENLERVSCIFHMGACSSTTERNMDYLLRNNTDYTVDLYRICEEKNIPFIYASSAATYGDGDQGFSDEHDVVKSLRPINPYGYSKQLADKAILAKDPRGYNFWCALKFFNVYGPNEYHKKEMRSLVAKACPQVEETKQMRLFKSHKEGYKDGEQKRDFIYVKDVVDLMLHIYDHYEDLESGVYNVGTGQARTFLDLGKALFKALDISPKFEFIPMPESIRNQYQYFTEANMTRVREKLKYSKEMTSLEDGIRDYVQNYLTSHDPYL